MKHRHHIISLPNAVAYAVEAAFDSPSSTPYRSSLPDARRLLTHEFVALLFEQPVPDQPAGQIAGTPHGRPTST